MKRFSESEGRVWRVSGDKNCPHETTIMLGSDKGNNQYYQCQGCGAVIISEGESSPEQQERERMKREKEEEKSGFNKFMEKLRRER